MNNNKEFVVVSTRYSEAYVQTNLMSFDNKKEADAAFKQAKEGLAKSSRGWAVSLVEKRKYSLADIYMKLLESNPMGSASDMWTKAQEVFNLIEAEFDKK